MFVARLVLSLAAFAGASFTVSPVFAQDDTAVLESIVVSGEQPGPGLWKAVRGDHVVWILGTHGPLPEKMSWRSKEVEDTIAQAQEVVLTPNARLDVKGGMVGGLFLLPTAMAARNNPDDAKLEDVVPADLYARWLALKATYIGRDNGVEKRRPIFAAFELYEKATEKSGLTGKDLVEPVVKRIAKKHKVAVTEPRLELRLEKARATLKSFARSELDDLDCFRKTLERLETDLPVMQARANAWATGDLETFTGLTFVDHNRACRDTMLASSVVQERGMDNLPERIMQTWFDAVEAAASKHATTLALFPVSRLVNDAPGGVLERLRAKGFTIEPPE